MPMSPIMVLFEIVGAPPKMSRAFEATMVLLCIFGATFSMDIEVWLSIAFSTMLPVPVCSSQSVLFGLKAIAQLEGGTLPPLKCTGSQLFPIARNVPSL